MEQIDRPLSKALAFKFCSAFVRKNLHKFATGKSRGGGYILSDYVAQALQQATPATSGAQAPEFPYREKGTIKGTKRHGWMLWYIPGDAEGCANIEARFENGTFKELKCDPKPCRCGDKRYAHVSLGAQGKIVLMSTCESCTEDAAWEARRCHCSGCQGGIADGACWC